MNRRAVTAVVVAAMALLSLVPTAAANPRVGENFGVLSISAIGISFPMFQGDSGMCEGKNSATLNNGVSHYPCSAFPWEIGTVAVAGHRTTHVAPFRRLDRLKVGQKIELQTRRGNFLYEVVRSKIVRPSWTFNPEVPGRLILSTCYPAGSDAYRLVIFAKEVKKLK